jgi:hypothetical protein
VEFIILQFITYIQDDEYEASKAYRQSTYVNNCIFQVPGDIPESNKHVEFEHDLKNFVVVMVTTISVVMIKNQNKINKKSKY